MKYVVVSGHTLGYLIPEMPSVLGILHASILRGSPWNDLDGMAPIRPEIDTVRKATEKDFADFRVMLPYDFKEVQS